MFSRTVSFIILFTTSTVLFAQGQGLFGAPELPPLTREQEREITGRFRHVNLDDDFARAVFDECLNHASECSATDPKAIERRQPPPNLSEVLRRSSPSPRFSNA